ncbi:MAG: DNA repair protein RecO [Lysobacteraceae bacterium]
MRVDLQPCYLLHARPYRETSLLLEVLARDHGRVGLIARGVRNSNGHRLRAQLQPGRPLLLGWRDASELPVLGTVEAGATLPRITGDALLALFYINELLVRLLPQREAQSALFDHYALLIAQLADAVEFGAALRVFEYRLLSSLGYAPMLDFDLEGTPIEAGVLYRHLGDQGMRRVPAASSAARVDVAGEALIALRDGFPLKREWLGSLRRLLRQCISEQLDGRPLQSWRLARMLSGSSGTGDRLSPQDSPEVAGEGVSADLESDP